jgi:hypothetical protein
MDHNPYDPPRAAPNDRQDVNDADDLNNLDALLEAEDNVEMTDEQAVALRQPLLTHEAWIQSVGFVMSLGAIFLILGPLISLSLIGGDLNPLGGVEARGLPSAASARVVLGLLLTAFGALSLRAGQNLQRLQVNDPVQTTSLVLLWLGSGSPLSLFGLWSLYLLYSKAGATVLSARYQQARRRTPQLQAKRSRMNKITLFVLGLVMVDPSSLARERAGPCA